MKISIILTARWRRLLNTAGIASLKISRRTCLRRGAMGIHYNVFLIEIKRSVIQESGYGIVARHATPINKP
jgi:hypothetical protein